MIVPFSNFWYYPYQGVTWYLRTFPSTNFPMWYHVPLSCDKSTTKWRKVTRSWTDLLVALKSLLTNFQDFWVPWRWKLWRRSISCSESKSANWSTARTTEQGSNVVKMQQLQSSGLIKRRGQKKNKKKKKVSWLWIEHRTLASSVLRSPTEFR